MTHSYLISGITCAGCIEKVKKLLQKVPGIKSALVGLDGKTDIQMDRHICISLLQAAIKDHSQYRISENLLQMDESEYAVAEEKRSWFSIYKPIILIFIYLILISLIGAHSVDGISIPTALRLFMGGFFLGFSFFKFLDLTGFAESYSMYDIIAVKIRSWGNIYPFVELSLGISFLLNVCPLMVNSLTLVIMIISLIGVVKSLLNKRQIKCACLGAVFNLPMSFITVLEDSVMIVMSLYMISNMI